MSTKQTFLAALILAAGFGVAAPTTAQEAPAPAEAEAEALPAEAPEDEDFGKPMGPEDAFNRGTPRGSMHGYLSACNDGDFERAAAYLDLRRLRPDDRPTQGPDLARKLKVVLDRTQWVDLASLSDGNRGMSEDGLPAWRDRMGRLETEKGAADLLLQRVPREGDEVRIWKVSSETVERVPDFYREFGYGPLVEWLPNAFFQVQAVGLQLWQWIGVLAAITFAWLVAWLFSSAVIRILRPLYSSTRSSLDDRLVRLVQGPVRLVLTVLLFTAATVPLGFGVATRDWIGRIEQTLLILAFTWFLLRLVDLVALMARERLVRTGQTTATHFVAPGRKTIKVVIVALAIIAALDNLGFNVTALVAGLGVGGIAIALAAQRPLENLFGGVTLFADRPVAVGDFCRFDGKVGTVEEIGMRATRIRTLDRTVISVPNADFVRMQIENFSKRDEIRLNTTLGLRYETTPEQLRFVLARLREMLLAHPRISPDPARVRFVSFGAYSLDLEIYAYARTTDWNEFLQIREDIFLRMMDIVAEAGSGFAFPSSTTYVGRDDGLDERAAGEATEQVRSWRREGSLPFPEFSEGHRDEIADTLDWPPEGSASGARARPRSSGAEVDDG